jgi:hypothetical protein
MLSRSFRAIHPLMQDSDARMVILPGIVDVIFRHKMDWFYRRHYTLPFVLVVPPIATWQNLTGYIMLYMILSLAFPIVIFILSDQGLTKIVLGLSLAFSIISIIMFVPLDLSLSLQNITSSSARWFVNTLRPTTSPDHWFFGRGYGQKVLDSE